jgi:hypothetical protein
MEFMTKKHKLLSILTVLLGLLLTSCGTTHLGYHNPALAANTITGGDHDLPFGDLRVWITAVDGDQKFSLVKGVNRKIPVSAALHYINVKVKLEAEDGTFQAKALLGANLEAGGHYVVTGERSGDKIDLWVERAGTKEIVSKVNTQELVKISFL